MRIRSPFKTWVILNFLASIIIGVGLFNIYNQSQEYNQSIVRTYWDILTRSRISDLNQGNFRNFVEGLGPIYRDMFIEIRHEGQIFNSGNSDGKNVCEKRKLLTYSEGSDVEVTMCIKDLIPYGKMIAFASIYLLFSIITLISLRRLQLDFLNGLFSFLEQTEVKLIKFKNLRGPIKKLEEIKNSILESKNSAIIKAKHETILQVSKQVVHDIGSPLSALEINLKRLRNNSGAHDQKSIILIDRIKDILTDLNSEELAVKTHNIKEIAKPISCMIFDIVNEFKVRSIPVKFDVKYKDLFLTSNITESDFKRIITNLINNSWDACDKVTGKVNVNISEGINITIIDNGQGISAEVLPMLGKQVFTNKENGNGLGVIDAFRKIESYGGRISYESQIGIGTNVTLSIPNEELKVISHSQLFLIHDDNNFVENFKKKTSYLPIKLSVFSNPHDFIFWFKNNTFMVPSFYLIGQSFINGQVSGANLIKFLKISQNSCLIVDDQNELEERKLSSRNGLKWLPKDLFIHLI